MAKKISCSCDGCAAAIEPNRAIAHGWVRAHAANRGGRAAWLCEYHANVVDSYYDENDKNRGKDTDGYTYGIEFEVMRYTNELRRHFLAHGFKATYDSTVDCEFKSPIFRNRKWHRLLETAEQLISEGHGCVDSNCGTHFHVGHEMINSRSNNALYRNYHALFDALSAEMFDTPSACAALFGRALERYSWAQPVHMGYVGATEHENFANIQHDDTIEWRICKFVSAKQYKLAMACCKDMTACVVTNYLSHIEYNAYGEIRNIDKAAHKAQVTSKKLVKIYRKYADKARAL